MVRPPLELHNQLNEILLFLLAPVIILGPWFLLVWCSNFVVYTLLFRRWHSENGMKKWVLVAALNLALFAVISRFEHSFVSPKQTGSGLGFLVVVLGAAIFWSNVRKKA